MTNMPWFRVYSDILDDRKIKKICRNTGQSKALIIGVWVSLLAIANASDTRGALNISENIAYTLEDLEDELQLSRELIVRILDEFRKFNMIGGEELLTIENWEKRQFKSDHSTERVQKFRKKKNAEPPDSETDETPDETDMKRSGNVLDTESDTETERESESESESDTAPKTRAAAADLPSGLYRAFLEAVYDPDPPPKRTPYPEWEAIFAELAEEGVQPVDIQEAVRWLRANGKHPRHPRAIMDSARVAMRQRGSSPREPVPEQRSRYLRGPYAALIEH